MSTKELRVKASIQLDGDRVEQEVIVLAGHGSSIEEPIPKGSTSLAFALAFATAKLKCIQLKAVGSDLTLVFTYTGNNGTKTVQLAVGETFFWANGLGSVNPFAYDVASLAITEADVADATLLGKIGVDPT